MRLKVTKLYARSFDLDYLDLYWEIESFERAQDVITAYEFTILRSESPEGPFNKLAGPFKDQYRFRDFSQNLLHKWRQLYYKLQIRHVPTDETVDAGVCTLEAEPDLIALEIQRQEDVLFREFVGRPCWLFPVRMFGEKCTCFDRVMNRQTHSNCITCFDTGFIGGYMTPIEIWMQIDPDSGNPQNTSIIGEIQPKNTSCRVGPYPPIKAKDLIVEAENRRWKVVTQSGTERLRAIVHQELSLHLVVKGDVEFKLPINISDLRRTWAQERNFTNPQHVDDMDYKESELLDIYDGSPRGAQ